MNSQHALLVSSAIWVFAGTSRAQANFTPIGTLGTRPTAMSSDGVWITGAGPAGGQTFRWSLATGISSFNSGSDGFADIAIGGSPVAATLVNTNGDEVAGLWTPGGTFLSGFR